MRYNFRRLSGIEWFKLIKKLRKRNLEFIKVTSYELYNPEKVNDITKVYYYSTTSGCKVVFYEWKYNKWWKTLREISFSPKEIDPVKCVLNFRKIASNYGENISYEPSNRYSNGVYSYYKGHYDGKVTVLDMNSAYLWALSQPLADWTTKEECSPKEVWSKKYDYYLFENPLHREMIYKDDLVKIQGAMIWSELKIYGFKSKLYYQKTTKELYRLKTEVDKEKYKNVANIAVGCMHKRSNKQNNTTLAASLYAFFEFYIKSLVEKFEKSKYNVIMITTDSIKLVGDYREEDNIIKIGSGLGEFKVEYKGLAKYISEGHYTEEKTKWKGKPLYMIEGYPRCKFIENIDKEKNIYEKFAIR